MIDPLNPRSRRDTFGSKINRDHLPLLAYGIPWLSIMIGSLTPLLPLIAPAPIIPPMGFIMLLAWRLMRPGLLAPWAGLPLGLFDDLFSGQPFGSAIMLFSITLIGADLLELRFPWRTFWQDWGTAVLAITAYLAITALLSGAGLDHFQPAILVPQLLLSSLLFPIVARLVALLDRIRLMRIRRIS